MGGVPSRPVQPPRDKRCKFNNVIDTLLNSLMIVSVSGALPFLRRMSEKFRLFVCAILHCVWRDIAVADWIGGACAHPCKINILAHLLRSNQAPSPFSALNLATQALF